MSFNPIPNRSFFYFRYRSQKTTAGVALPLRQRIELADLQLVV
jgi:hypothetical protein